MTLTISPMRLVILILSWMLLVACGCSLLLLPGEERTSVPARTRPPTYEGSGGR